MEAQICGVVHLGVLVYYAEIIFGLALTVITLLLLAV
jgi:hypothetical protein